MRHHRRLVPAVSLSIATALLNLMPQGAGAQANSNPLRMRREYGVRLPFVLSVADYRDLGFGSGLGFAIGAELVRPRSLVLVRLGANTSDKRNSAGTSYLASAMAYRDFGRLEGFSAGIGLRASLFDGAAYERQAVRAALGLAYTLDEQRLALEFAGPVSDRTEQWSAAFIYRYALRGTRFIDWIELDLIGSAFKTQGVPFLHRADARGMSADYTVAQSFVLSYAISFNGPRPEKTSTQ